MGDENGNIVNLFPKKEVETDNCVTTLASSASNELPIVLVPNTNELNQAKEKKASKDVEEGMPTMPLTTSQKVLQSRRKMKEKRMRFQPKSVIGERSNYYEKYMDEEDSDLKIPKTINSKNFAVDHIEEIQSMLRALKQHSGNKTPMQLLPHHMRRRMASHNSKRLPRQIQEYMKSKQDLKSSDSKKKELSRKSRRRNIKLQNEYARRKGKRGWLETHLWHSKRFRMSGDDPLFAEWGCCLALDPYQKSYRPACRALSKHCVVQDISFYKCIEIRGSSDLIINKTLLTFLCQEEIVRLKSDNLKESEVLLYDRANTPARCIGPARISFIPATDEEKSCCMWMWLHPIILKQVVEMLEEIREDLAITIEDISNTLNRFQLTGPKSSVVLLSVLRSFVQKKIPDDGTSELKSWLNGHKKLMSKQHSLFVSVMKDCHNRHFHPDSTESSAICCEDGDVFPLVINDPRLTLPVRATAPTLDTTAEEARFDDVSAFKLNRLCNSPLWNAGSRKEVSASRLPDHVVSTRKSETKLCAGEELTKLEEEMATPVCIAVVRRSGYEKPRQGQNADPPAGDSRSVHGGPAVGFGSGWDLILPSNWSMAFWIPLIYHQVRPIGLHMSFQNNLERKHSTFPQDYPDTEVGCMWWKNMSDRHHTDHYKKPCSKRTNYSVLATRSPFSPCWRLLFNKSPSRQTENVKVGSPTGSPAIGDNVLTSDDLKVQVAKKTTLKRPRDDVIADEELPTKFSKSTDDCDSFSPFVLRDEKKLKQINQIIECSKENLDVLMEIESKHENTLVGFKVSPLNKGVPFSCTGIYIPTVEDVEKLRDDFQSLYNNGLQDCVGPKEQKHWDPYRKERKEVSKLAKKNKKRKSNKRIEIKHNRPRMFDVEPSRNLIGYVTSGNYLFSFAAGGGVGFISLPSISTLITIKRNSDWLPSFMRETVKSSGLLVLMRTIDSEQYRFAILDLIF